MADKAYTKNTWTDEVLAGVERYNISENDGTPITENARVELSTNVAVAGSPVSADRMNNIEEGIDNIDTLLSSGGGANQYLGGDKQWHNFQREVLTASRTYYVRTDGDDSNTGLENNSDGAFLTGQKAVDVISSTLDIAGQVVTIQIGDGTYTGPITLKNVVGYAAPGNLVIQGNSGTPTNVVISTTGTCIIASGISTVWDLKDFKVASSTNIGIYVKNAAVRFSGIDYGTCAGAHLYLDANGSVDAIGNYTVSANSPYHWYLNAPFAFLNTAGFTITFSNNPVFTTFAHATILGSMFVHVMTFTNGATVTGKRYSSELNSVIYTGGGGANYLPGNSAGTTSGGMYV